MYRIRAHVANDPSVESEGRKCTYFHVKIFNHLNHNPNQKKKIPSEITRLEKKPNTRIVYPKMVYLVIIGSVFLSKVSIVT